MKTTLHIITLALLFLLLAWNGWKVWEQASAYEAETLYIISQLEAETQLENSGRQLLEAISFGLYGGYSETLKQINQHKALQAAYYQSVRLLTGLFFAIAAAIAVISWSLRRRLLDLGYGLITVAFVTLAVGLTTPILSLEASKELPLLGETVFQFQSKGILTTIISLKDHGNGWLAALLFLFSVIIPMAKTLTTWLTLFSRTHSFSLHGLHLSRHLGKWSMADVFVVAILVVFFSAAGEESMTQAEVQAGLWFFAAYVLLSLIGTQLIAHGRAQNSTS
ncbi:MAG: paraquat-inducible protein A [Sedimenticola sp.]